MKSEFDTAMLTAIVPLREAGFALHYLHPRAKRPIGERWSEAPVASLDVLRRTHSAGNNLGVRLGEPSLLASGEYLHAFDIDIRIPELADEAWAALDALLPGYPIESLPSVRSGSGGESRHIYFSASVPFSGRKLAVSEGKHRDAAGKWHLDWEIVLYGTGLQVALPPSIHPDSGLAYAWEREFDFDALAFGDGPSIDADLIRDLGAAETAECEFERREPLTFEPGQLERDLAALPVARLDDYFDWVMLGQALHHQFGASDEGFDIWVAQSRRSEKFDGKLREMKRKWRGFGRHRGKPVTMATIRLWAQEARAAALVDEFDDIEDGDDDSDFDALIHAPSPPAAADDDDFDKDADKPEALPWKSLLDLNEEGVIKGTLHNLRLIVENDPWTAGVMAFNEFTQDVVQKAKPGAKKARRTGQPKPVLQLTGSSWEMRDTVNGDFWTEDKDNAIRAVIESPKTQGGYGIKVPDRDLRAAIDIVGRKNAFHPVRNYLSGLKWDGAPRVELLFIDYMGSPDDPYTRAVARLMMTAAVARVFEPGIKFDFAIILQGLQGKRKSTFIQVLAKDWFAELEGDFDDPKQMVEMMQGAWILEMPELGGFVRADVRHIKAFVSRRSDKVRLAYAKRAQEYHRQCIFIGSTNDDKFLKDDTGNRRFWPIRCTVDSIDTDRLEREVDQMWAEALTLYRSMRAAHPRGGLPLYLTEADAQCIAARLQESARVESADDGTAGQIEAWLNKPIVTGDIDQSADGQLRNVTCLKELWIDCLGNDERSYNQQSAQMLGRAMSKLTDWAADGRYFTFGRYGRQRAYDRGGYNGFVSRLAETTAE